MSNQKNKFRFRGKQILLFGLVALVITAGYYRWTVEQERLNLAVPTAGEAAPSNNEETENKQGEDNTDNSAGTAEISKLKQDRDSARGQSLEEWKKISSSADTSQEGKKDAEKKISKAAENAERERNIETLVKAKGYDDCIAYVDENGVSVTVQGGEIDGSHIAQIKDIIVSETGVAVKNIKINAI